jgi:putative IMPACT (imprinted ancient) family translation regulator
MLCFNIDNDDDGEDAAGTRLAHLLDIMVLSPFSVLRRQDLKNVMVIVSRWYGGVMLHGDRFKHISNVGREALEVGGFFPKHTSEPGKSGSKKKSRKRK